MGEWVYFTRICRGWRACLESPLSSLETGLLSIAAIISFRSQRDRWFLAVSAGAILASEVASGMAAGRAFAVAGARERVPARSQRLANGRSSAGRAHNLLEILPVPRMGNRENGFVEGVSSNTACLKPNPLRRSIIRL